MYESQQGSSLFPDDWGLCKKGPEWFRAATTDLAIPTACTGLPFTLPQQYYLRCLGVIEDVIQPELENIDVKIVTFVLNRGGGTGFKNDALTTFKRLF